MLHWWVLQSIFKRKSLYLMATLGIFFSCWMSLWIWQTAWVTQTTLRLEIIQWFTWTLTPIYETYLFDNWIYRTTWTHQTVAMISSVQVDYELSWATQQLLSWSLWAWVTSYVPLDLLPWDWPKQITASYLPTWDNEYLWVLPFWITYHIDTTPPPLSYSFSWPDAHTPGSEPIPFSRIAVVDTGVGLHHYLIQLSLSSSFSTAMEFTTTGTQLILWWWTLSSGRWYRRRWAVDTLWNIIYSTPIEFTVEGWWEGWWGGGGSSSTIWINKPQSPEPTPRSDQCPMGDESGNYFDGLCSATILPPTLINIPQEHQANSREPRREKAWDRLTKQQKKLYVFPSYEPPKPYTIYEYDNTLTDEITIYEVNEAHEQQTLWTQEMNSATEYDKNFDYLRRWEGNRYPTCSWLYQYCPVVPLCTDYLLWCEEIYFVCYATNIPRCPRVYYW